MPERRISFLLKTSLLFWVYLAVSIAVTLHKYWLGPDHYKNFLIFKNSFLHLISGKDLYILYPDLKIDLFKYSPSFAVLFAPFAWMPDLPGLILWNVINAMLLYFSIRWLVLEERRKAFLLWFILIELITSLQNFQSNALTAALIILVFVSLEKKKYITAGVSVATGLFIKLFGILGALFWFLYGGKGKFFLSSILCGAGLIFLPLIFVSPEELLGIYTSWFALLASDPVHELNHSVISVMRSWFGLDPNPVIVQAAGAVLLVLPFVHHKFFAEKDFRILFLASVLIWSVIFNHKAESPTYVIAVAGAGIWFFSSLRKPVDTGLIVFLFLVTCLSSTDLFPKMIRDNYVVPNSLKAVPCILVWIRIQYDLLFYKRRGAAN